MNIFPYKDKNKMQHSIYLSSVLLGERLSFMILGLFNEYFLGLVIILSLQVILYDGREFLNRNQVKRLRKQGL